MSSSSCLFSIVIKKRRDFLVLENTVRELLRCDSTACSFFQSAAYIQLRLAISAYVLQKPPVSPRPAPCILIISNSTFMLNLADDGCTLLILPTTMSAPVPSSKKTTSEICSSDQHQFSKMACYEKDFLMALTQKTISND